MTEQSTNPVHAQTTRRTVVMGAAAVAGAAGMSGLLPTRLEAAAAAEPEEFDLSRIKHVVYVMQENRSFDHYFGTFPGVRGFDDPDAMTLANGNSVFMQPDAANPDGYLLPFHMDTKTTGAAAIPSLSHDWRDQHASWNKGAMDGWLSTHVASDGAAKGSYTMGYMTQDDIPFHWALAENFTLLDNYHCSVMGPTYPNRAIWMSGTNDPQGQQGGPILETVAPNTLTWKSAAEVLWDAGYTVKTYTSSGSYNYFKWWQSFKTPGQVDTELYNLVNGTGTLYGNGQPGGVGDPLNPTRAAVSYLAFEEDCANGTLADVTWLFPDGPYASDEHPPNTPAAGAYFLASKLEALASNPDLWASTVFIINYDENDGFFDHVPPPVPDPVLHAEEYVDMPSPRGTPGGGLPAGAGFRVPCLIISPWTVGGHVYSQVADHTSPLQLIEAIAAAGGLSGHGPVTFDAITSWRRSTFDDLAGAFQPVAGQAAPGAAMAAADPDVRQADYSAQLTASALPMPARPGAAQTVPHQLPTDPASAPTGPVSSGQSSVTVSDAVRSGRKAAVTVTGAKPSTKVVARHSHGSVVGRTTVDPDGTASLRIGTDHLKVGHQHRYTVTYVDASGHHHTRNVAFQVTR
ncbi:phospholipase C [Nocardioides mangrovi]|uniref:phospholipase C n=1 Tax=Nocardioides mangrovi TaxID=2874580 RepID=A0ABS7UBC7_9ACTN|nr:alkaline phosphatase family protein [Nocardioides mangrovi]MBZ5737952.1 phospholipase [Nocardioides mangrovi]